MATMNSIGSLKPIQVSFGGTGDATLTAHGVLVGNTTSAVTALTVGTNGQVLLGSTGADPVFATLASAGGTITFTPGAGTLNLEAPAAASGTNHSVIVGTGTGLSSLAVGTNGQVLLGSTGAHPVFATLASAGGTITFTPGAGTLNLEAPASASGTLHSVILGTGAGLTSLAVGATGEILVGATGADPAWSATPTVTTLNATTVNATTFDTNVVAAAVTLSGTTLSADGSDANININITAKGTGQVIIDDLQLTTDLAVTEGGTGASTLTDHGVLVGSGTAAVTPLAVGTNGQVLLGATGADPVFATLTSSGGTVTFTPGAGTLNLESSSSGVLPWTEVTGTSVAMVVNHGYVLNNATPCQATLPATAAVGSIIKITGKENWQVRQNAGQKIYHDSLFTTTGVGGYVFSGFQRSSMELVCVVANTTFNVVSLSGPSAITLI